MDYFWSFYQGYNSTSTASVKVHGARLQWVKNYKHVSSTVNSVYLKKYKNGEGVFEVTMGFYFSNDNLEHVREPGGTQTFYVSETDGKWEILSIGPFINKDK